MRALAVNEPNTQGASYSLAAKLSWGGRRRPEGSSEGSGFASIASGTHHRSLGSNSQRSSNGLVMRDGRAAMQRGGEEASPLRDGPIRPSSSSSQSAFSRTASGGSDVAKLFVHPPGSEFERVLGLVSPSSLERSTPTTQNCRRGSLSDEAVQGLFAVEPRRAELLAQAADLRLACKQKAAENVCTKVRLFARMAPMLQRILREESVRLVSVALGSWRYSCACTARSEAGKASEQAAAKLAEIETRLKREAAFNAADHAGRTWNFLIVFVSVKSIVIAWKERASNAKRHRIAAEKLVAFTVSSPAWQMGFLKDVFNGWFWCTARAHIARLREASLSEMHNLRRELCEAKNYEVDLGCELRSVEACGKLLQVRVDEALQTLNLKKFLPHSVSLVRERSAELAGGMTARSEGSFFSRSESPEPYRKSDKRTNHNHYRENAGDSKTKGHVSPRLRRCSIAKQDDKESEVTQALADIEAAFWTMIDAESQQFLSAEADVNRLDADCARLSSEIGAEEQAAAQAIAAIQQEYEETVKTERQKTDDLARRVREAQSWLVCLREKHVALADAGEPGCVYGRGTGALDKDTIPSGERGLMVAQNALSDLAATTEELLSSLESSAVSLDLLPLGQPAATIQAERSDLSVRSHLPAPSADLQQARWAVPALASGGFPIGRLPRSVSPKPRMIIEGPDLANLRQSIVVTHPNLQLARVAQQTLPSQTLPVTALADRLPIPVQPPSQVSSRTDISV